MVKNDLRKVNWISNGKTIQQLILELQSFENKDLFVELSLDGGDSSKSISLVAKIDGKCVLINCED
ncbi:MULTISPECIES: hypothetical protein [Acinetobacter]|uniref:Uncharacterized protein n=1 Tax=Acinetobacter geminorum TaxID=2730922 RepID=A0ABT8Z9U9_9GAMM|nr:MULTISPECIES: hypothetical protein [Acinetobacter]MCU4360592.1 hypothetical protein [Acinetobacter sp. WU_MDCI_Abxc22]MDO7361496.1 hypothetical protein [Acinetobacter geminorum]OTL18360.1 hypothetical protein B9X79_11110 [Acinetobacter pittii]